MEPGTRLGPYEVERKLGEGGMGEVYLAQDTRLGRKVAVKVLPAAFAADAERLARFEQEARAAAALNHPHIAAVFDVGFENGTHFMVQEFLQGATLRDALDAQSWTLERTLEVAAEVAEGLAAAHAAGVVHRDLKPENVFVAGDGHAKILDFGLAKLVETTATGASPEQATSMGTGMRSPTLLGTAAGGIMGTAAYMAPEQVEAGTIDGRTDVFALGAMLYEMASGRRPFAGESAIDVLHAVVRTTPLALGEAAADVPLELQRIVDKALQKPPARRYQTADDMALDLRALSSEVAAGRAPRVGAGSGAAGHAGAQASRTPLIAAVVLSLLTGALLSWALAPNSGSSTPEPPRFVALDGPPGLDDGNRSQMAISPQGRYVALATGRGPAYLWDLYSAGGLRAVPGTDGGLSPFFSPDGVWLAYRNTDNRLFRVPVAGGQPQAFTEKIRDELGAPAWLDNGEIWLGASFGEPILRLNAARTTVEPLLGFLTDDGEMGHGTGLPLPGGEHVLYAFWDDRWRIGLRSTRDDTRTVLLDGYAPRYVPTGHLVFVRNGVFMGATFDLATRRVGEPVQLITDVGATPGWGRPGYDFSTDGTLVYLAAPADRGQSVVRIEAGGVVTPLPIPRRDFNHIALSSSEQRVALGVLDPQSGSEIWLYDLQRNDFVPIAQDPGWDQYPEFVDEDTIGYSGEYLGGGDLFTRPANGSGEATPVVTVPIEYMNDPTWSRAGHIVARRDRSTSSDLVAFTPEDRENSQPFATSSANEYQPEFSPDGRFVAYESDRSGRIEIYVAPYPGGQAQFEWKVSTGGGRVPRWTADGGRIYFEQDDAILFARVESVEPFRTGPAEFFARPAGDSWTISPDGRYALSVEGAEPPRPRVIFNWFAELQRLVPNR